MAKSVSLNIATILYSVKDGDYLVIVITELVSLLNWYGCWFGYFFVDLFEVVYSHFWICVITELVKQFGIVS